MCDDDDGDLGPREKRHLMLAAAISSSTQDKLDLPVITSF